jgi:hypothetical protein
MRPELWLFRWLQAVIGHGIDSEIRAALEKIIALDEKLSARGTRLLRAVASEAEDGVPERTAASPAL